MKRCRITSLSAPCWLTATTRRVVRSTLSATVNFSGRYGLGRIKPFSWRIGRYVRSGELIEAPSIGGLADAIGVEKSVLSATVDNYNADARMRA